MSWETAIIIVFVILGVIYFYRQHHTESEVQQIAKETMPLWASFAPFKNGHDSAMVMFYCQWALKGKKFVDGLEKQNAYRGHADSYERDVDKWKNLIKQSSEIPIDGLEKKRRLVTSLFEIDQLRQEGKSPEWDSYTALGHMILFPQNKSAEKLLETLKHTMEANSSIKEKTSNLIEDYVVFYGTGIDQNLSTGILCYICLQYADENPSLDKSKEIVDLKDKMFDEHKANNDKDLAL